MALLDISIPFRPRVEALEKLHSRVLKAHLVFVALWGISAYTVQSVAVSLGRLLGPLGEMVSVLYPKTSIMFVGPLGQTFYQSITAETFVIALVLGLLYAALFVGRYGDQLWRYVEFLAERMPTKVFSIGFSIFILGCAGLMWLFLFVAALWFGVIPFPDPQKPVQPHQLALWSIMCSALPTLLMFLATTLISYAAYTSRRICFARS